MVVSLRKWAPASRDFLKNWRLKIGYHPGAIHVCTPLQGDTGPVHYVETYIGIKRFPSRTHWAPLYLVGLALMKNCRRSSIAQTHHDKINTRPIILQSLWNINAASSSSINLFYRWPDHYMHHRRLKKVNRIAIKEKGARPRASPPPDAPSYE